jgi:urocanate hydratase
VTDENEVTTVGGCSAQQCGEFDRVAPNSLGRRVIIIGDPNGVGTERLDQSVTEGPTAERSRVPDGSEVLVARAPAVYHYQIQRAVGSELSRCHRCCVRMHKPARPEMMEIIGGTDEAKPGEMRDLDRDGVREWITGNGNQ